MNTPTDKSEKLHELIILLTGNFCPVICPGADVSAYAKVITAAVEATQTNPLASVQFGSTFIYAKYITGFYFRERPKETLQERSVRLMEEVVKKSDAGNEWRDKE